LIGSEEAHPPAEAAIVSPKTPPPPLSTARPATGLAPRPETPGDLRAFGVGFMLLSTLTFFTLMSYADPEPRITWDRSGLFQGVTIEREIQGARYAERIPHNGLVSQALAALLLGVSHMSVNNWVRAGKLQHVKVAGQPSAIPLSEVKRVKQILAKERRLRGR